MSTIDKILKLERLHKLIQNKYVGSADDYSAKLNISRSCLFNYIDELKNAGAVIEYSRSLNSFIYLNDFVFQITIKSASICHEGLDNILGGSKSFLLQSNYLDGRYIFSQLECEINLLSG